jgi:maleate cis-trans isomerase
MNGMDALFSACNEVTTLRLLVDGEKAKADPVRRARVATTFIMVRSGSIKGSERISIVDDQRKSQRSGSLCSST